MDLMFLTGCQRSGTTMMANWIEASALRVFAVRESGILTVAHWCLSCVRFMSRVTQFKDTYLEHIDRLTQALYRRIGWDGKQVVTDKQPYSLSDMMLLHEHLRLLFDPGPSKNSLLIVYTLRNPFDTINSMRNRTWGNVRGSVLQPDRTYTYWDESDVNNFISPLAFKLSAMENTVGDVSVERGTNGVWSLEKCCLHYRNSLGGPEFTATDKVLIVDYDHLADPAYRKWVKAAIEDRRRIKVSCEIPYQATRRHSLMSDDDQARVREYLGADCLSRYERLREIARQSLRSAA